MQRFLRLIQVILALSLPAFALPAGNNWMESIGDTVRLSQISIPGTHDSGARVEPLSGIAKCQNATIAEQLGYGVRLLDIRCKHVNNAFAIYHGSVNQNLTFTQVLDQVIGFLNANPGESVVMSIKEEGDSSGATRSFEATFDSYVSANPTKWSLATGVPALNSVRGKIQLLRRFGTSVAKGINATNWPDNTSFNVNNLSVQDWYEVTDNATKWTYITNEFNAAFSDTNANVLHLNFASGYRPGLFGIPNITTVSNAINPQLTTYFTNAPPGHYGCVLMDFADATNTALIYRTNFIAPVFTTTPITRAAVLKNSNYSATLAGSATDANAGDSLSYAKISGPAWLNIAASGALSGTPGNADVGPNIFTLRVTDAAGLFAETTLNITVADVTAYWDLDGMNAGAGGSSPSGVWNTSDSWNSAADGTGPTLAWLPGQSAVFAAGSNGTGIYTVTLVGTQDISGLAFEDGTITLAGGTALRLIANSMIQVNPDRTATISTPLSEDASPRSITKTGPGILKLSHPSNSYTGATTISAGTLALAANHVLPNSSAISIGNATLDAATFTDTAGTLGLTGTATIHLDSGAALAFADGSSLDWSGGTLNITGTFVSGSSLRFGSGSNGLTHAQLARISAPGIRHFSLNSSGYLIQAGYTSWQSANNTDLAIHLDHDQDGVANGVEYFLGGTANTTGFTALPTITDTNGVFSIAWTKSADYPGTYGTDFSVETSSTLADDWTTEIASPNPDFTVHIEGNQIKYYFPTGPRNFARLKVTGP